MRWTNVWIAMLFAIVAQPAVAQDWATAWATAPIALDRRDNLPAPEADGVTLRQTVLLTLPAERVRIRLTNRFGTAPLDIAGVQIARAPRAGSAAIVAGSAVPVRFAGRAEVTIPTGADYASDPIAIEAPALTHIAVTIHYRTLGGRQSGHGGSQTTGHWKAGDALSDAAFAGATSYGPWLHLAAVEVDLPGAATIALLGDSITDGYGVTLDSDRRWPDLFARRLQAAMATRHLGVANLGIGGNRLLLDDIGPNALARLDADVLRLAGVRFLVILIGVNDLGSIARDGPVRAAEHDIHLRRMLAGYTQIVQRAREAGVHVIGGTILPYGGSAFYRPDAQDEAKRRAINDWLRTPGNVDAVIDFDALTRDPARPTHMAVAVDSGDGLHPSEAGLKTMADGVPLTLFAVDIAERCAGG